MRALIVSILVAVALTACAVFQGGGSSPTSVSFTVPEEAIVAIVQIVGIDLHTDDTSCLSTQVGLTCYYYPPFVNPLTVHFTGEFGTARAFYFTVDDLENENLLDITAQ